MQSLKADGTTIRLPAPEVDLSKGILDAMTWTATGSRSGQCRILPDEHTEIEPVPTGGNGHRPEPELDHLSNVLKAFNDLLGDVAWHRRDRVGELITESIAAQVAADSAFRNTRQNSDDANTRIELFVQGVDEVQEGVSPNC